VHSEEGRLLEFWQFLPGELADFLGNVCWQEEGQDVAEYAVMVAVIPVIAIGTIRLIGSHADNVFANLGSSIQ
jgi:Flp pilus assembly pilin Flp